MANVEHLWTWRETRPHPELYCTGHGVQCPAMAPGGWQCALVEGHEALHHEQRIHWSDDTPTNSEP